MNAPTPPPPLDPWAHNVRAADVPISGDETNPAFDGFEATSEPLVPNKVDIAAHLYALFEPAFVKAYPDAWIEIAYGYARTGGGVNAAQNFSVFDLEKAVQFAEAKNRNGYNLYAGPAIRQGDYPKDGRSNKDHVVTSAFAWAEFEGEGEAARIDAVLKENGLAPRLVVGTGTVPYRRDHLYFKLSDVVTPDKLRAANDALVKCLGSDSVQDLPRVMRLAGTINYPTPEKASRGYITELVTFRHNRNARAFSAEELIALSVGGSNRFSDNFDFNSKSGRNDDELIAKLEESRTPGNWHNSIRDAIATMVGREWSDAAIKLACASYCTGGANDPDLIPLIDGAREKWNKPNDAGERKQRSLPAIQIKDGELSTLATRAEDALIAAGASVYQRSGALVRPVIETVDAARNRKTKIAQLKALDTVYTRDLLGKHAVWERYDARKIGWYLPIRHPR